MVAENRTNDQKFDQILVECQSILIDMKWDWEQSTVERYKYTGVSVHIYMRHAYETFQIAAGWSNICFKDVLQASRTLAQSAQNNFKSDKEWDVCVCCFCLHMSSQILLLLAEKRVSVILHFGWAKVLSKMQWGRKTTVSEKGTCERTSESTNGKMF